MAVTQGNLNNAPETVDTTLDNVTIPVCFEDYSRTLDVSGVAAGVTVIQSGHVILRNRKTGVHFPQKVTGGNYVATVTTVGSEEDYAGILKVSILVSKPFAAIMTRGSLNTATAPYKVLSEGMEALKLINFIKD